MNKEELIIKSVTGKSFNLVSVLKKMRPVVELCPNIDCNKGVDEENFDTPCARCKGKGYIVRPLIAVGKYEGDEKSYATVELEFLEELMRNY